MTRINFSLASFLIKLTASYLSRTWVLKGLYNSNQPKLNVFRNLNQNFCKIFCVFYLIMLFTKHILFQANLTVGLPEGLSYINIIPEQNLHSVNQPININLGNPMGKITKKFLLRFRGNGTFLADKEVIKLYNLSILLFYLVTNSTI